MEARINVADVAGNAARQIREQESSSIAHFLNCHRTTERRILFHHTQKLAKALNAGCSERLDRTGGNGIGANAFTAE